MHFILEEFFCRIWGKGIIWNNFGSDKKKDPKKDAKKDARKRQEKVPQKKNVGQK